MLLEALLYIEYDRCVIYYLPGWGPSTSYSYTLTNLTPYAVRGHVW